MNEEHLKYIETWYQDVDCLGVLLCGSYAYGLHTANSDIDIRIIYRNRSKKKNFVGVINIGGTVLSFRGGTEFNYYQTMYNCLHEGQRFEIRNFANGKILYKKNNTLFYLVKEAKFLMKKSFPRMSKDVQIAYLYKIWYSYDKLKNLRTDDPFFKLNYYNFLSEILQSYSKLIQCETTSEHKYSQFFSSDEFRKKYNIKQFDDNEFMGLWLQANKQINRRNSKLLYEYVMGRFNEININDFKIYI